MRRATRITAPIGLRVDRVGAAGSAAHTRDATAEARPTRRCSGRHAAYTSAKCRGVAGRCCALAKTCGAAGLPPKRKGSSISAPNIFERRMPYHGAGALRCLRVLEGYSWGTHGYSRDAQARTACTRMYPDVSSCTLMHPHVSGSTRWVVSGSYRCDCAAARAAVHSDVVRDLGHALHCLSRAPPFIRPPRAAFRTPNSGSECPYSDYSYPLLRLFVRGRDRTTRRAPMHTQHRCTPCAAAEQTMHTQHEYMDAYTHTQHTRTNAGTHTHTDARAHTHVNACAVRV